MNPIITISMAVWGRPERTLRSIKCILNQTIKNWEAIIIGDCCPNFEKVLRSDVLDDPRITAFNAEFNRGHCGFWAINEAIKRASGEYFIFFANDDCISPMHMQVYLNQIEGTDFDFVYYDYLAFGKLMKTKIKFARIGHSALIIRTAFLKTMPPHGGEYSHDWTLINNMIKGGAKYKKANPITPTYYVMSGNGNRIDPEGID